MYILFVILISNSEKGTALQSVTFETVELCQQAQKTLSNGSNYNIRTECLKAKNDTKAKR